MTRRPVVARRTVTDDLKGMEQALNATFLNTTPLSKRFSFHIELGCLNQIHRLFSFHRSDYLLSYNSWSCCAYSGTAINCRNGDEDIHICPFID
ncbi:protein of unknown function (plasmid) [Cupriavidus taiwanensis]|uniref:Uncharacterized protein n=1 Tax=Cupriavidus taiwanensis TaxID=164546 RepID=A0A375EBU6_9BURK|nr:protein of unknown function [Cupriavidus taiwanensis]SOZ72065.1 protein of unknown function [Cupriavidus taiwanensis]SOZ74382.1 protein of unknown function [Cupriavidus taiwanensis]SPA03288.1 protein of unknown function [Cupriavidus taiwanensis]SPA57230.1 protein of unknown function [Cupriavidus taiwanensis]